VHRVAPFYGHGCNDETNLPDDDRNNGNPIAIIGSF